MPNFSRNFVKMQLFALDVCVNCFEEHPDKLLTVEIVEVSCDDLQLVGDPAIELLGRLLV
jgi:hypothetical protein